MGLCMPQTLKTPVLSAQDDAKTREEIQELECTLHSRSLCHCYSKIQTDRLADGSRV